MADDSPQFEYPEPEHDHPTLLPSFVPGEVILRVNVAPGAPAHGWSQADWHQWVTNHVWTHCKSAAVQATDIKTESPFFSYTRDGSTIKLLKISAAPLLELRDAALKDAEKAEPLQDVIQKGQDSINLIAQMNRDKKAVNETSNAIGLTLEVVTANWLFSTMPHVAGHPMPGGMPVPIPNPAITSDLVATATKAKVKDAIAKTHVAREAIQAAEGIRANPKSSSGGANAVNIVILDTAPSAATFDETCQKFVNQGHTLLQNLKPQLQIHRAKTIDGIPGTGVPLPPDPDECPKRHYTHKNLYKINDHGLFIAGIIYDYIYDYTNDQAPNANIHLVEILNQYGASTLDSITTGIQWVIDNIDKNMPLVVNCSFGIDFLNGKELLKHLRDLGMTHEQIANIKLDDQAELAELAGALKELETEFKRCGVRIIASAGNAGRPGADAPNAYYPAAFDFVLGVGAINKDGGRAWYSNVADKPGNVGLLVFGGNMTIDAHGRSVTESNHGMMGIYIGDFPDGNPSQNGWARWAGTSFSAGVMSGMFAKAALDGCDIDPDAEVNYYEELKKKKDGETPGDQEPFIISRQKV
jgi:hypothetical protein